MSIYVFLLNNLDVIDDIKSVIKKIYYDDAVYMENVRWELTEKEMEKIEDHWIREHKIHYIRINKTYYYGLNGNKFTYRPFYSINPLFNMLWASKELEITNFIGSKTDMLCRSIYLKNQHKLIYTRRKR